MAKVVTGFLTGALAVLLFHQGMYFALKQLGLPLQGMPWSLAPAPSAFGMPVLCNQMFWGGLWGVLFAWIYHALPGGQGWLKGLLFGMVFPMLLGSWLVVAAIKGQPLLSGLLTDWNPMRLRTGFLLNGVAFGVGLGLLYPMLRGIFGRAD